jgi:hypothetical protein
MHFFITPGRTCSLRVNVSEEYFHVKVNEQGSAFILSQGKLLLGVPYSIASRALITQCIAVNWTLRPTVRQLLVTIEAVLEVVEEEVLAAKEVTAKQEQMIDNPMDYEGEVPQPDPTI